MEITDGTQVCKHCGLDNAQAVNRPPVQPHQPVQTATIQNGAAASRNTALVAIIAVLSTLVVCLIAGLLIILFMKNDKDSNNDNLIAEIATEATIATTFETTAATEATTEATTEVPTEATTKKNVTTEAKPTISYDLNGVADPGSYDNYVMYSSWEICHISATSTYLYYEPSDAVKPPETRCLYKNDNLEYLGTVGNFYYVRTNDGSGGYMYGYVPTKHVEFGAMVDLDNKYSWSYVTITGASANIRSSASKASSNNVIGTVYKGQSFSVYSYDGYWFCIDYNGRIGYVSHKMVTGG